MGSTSMRRERGMTDREFFEGEYPSLRDQIVACASMSAGGEWNRVFYAAVTNQDTAPHEPGITWALVILMHTSRSRDFNFSYKTLDETMGPGEDTCPDHILDLLSPTDNKYALQWRERCRARNAHRAKARELAPGQIVEFAQPLTFTHDHGQARRFRYLREGRRSVWLALSDDDQPRFRCRISHWRDRRFEIVSS